MSLSARFEQLPAPKYDSMQVKANMTVATRTTRDALLDAPLGASIVSEPRIIRPSANSLSQQQQKGKGKRKRKQDPMIAKRQRQQQQGNGNGTANWSDYRSLSNGFSNNRGRRFNANYGGQRQQHPQQQQQYVHHGQSGGGGGGGYKSYRTSGAPRRNPMNNAPYRRPPQNRQRARQLPPYQQQQQQGRQQGRQQHPNGFNPQQQQQRQGQRVRQRKVNPKFKNKGDGGASKTFSFKKAREANAASLDKELDAYHMKNPNVEDRNTTMEGNLDKELDDYFKGGQSQQSEPTQAPAQAQSSESANAST